MERGGWPHHQKEEAQMISLTIASEPITLNIDNEDLEARLQERAKRNGRTVNEEARQILKEALEKDPPPPPPPPKERPVIERYPDHLIINGVRVPRRMS
jgi:hypothetical protein